MARPETQHIKVQGRIRIEARQLVLKGTTTVNIAGRVATTLSTGPAMVVVARHSVNINRGALEVT